VTSLWLFIVLFSKIELSINRDAEFTKNNPSIRDNINSRSRSCLEFSVKTKNVGIKE
jgi:hypothetical protein